MFIVLQHGIFGYAPFDVATIPFEYFVGVAELLRRRGYDTFAPQVDPIGSVELRSLSLQQRIQDWLNDTPEGQRHRGEPLVMIAYSMGGLDARRMLRRTADAGGPPLDVRALVTIATPHRGTPVADVVINAASFRPALDLLRRTGLDVDGLMRLHAPGFPGHLPGFGASLLGALNDFRDHFLGDAERQLLRRLDALGINGNALVALDFLRPGGVDAVSNLTTDFCTRFDAATPDVAGTAYYSVSTSCRGAVPPWFDLSFRIVDAVEGDNDGVVPVQSATHATHIGTWPFDHLRAVNMPLPGSPAGGSAAVLQKYGELIDRLEADGVLA